MNIRFKSLNLQILFSFMADTLEVELILKDEKFDTKLNNSKRKLQDYGSAADLILKKELISEKSIQKFNLAEAKAEKLRRTLESVSRVSSGKGFDYLSISADKASKQVAIISQQLAGVRKQISETSNESIIKQLTKESRQLENELDKIKLKTDRFANRQSSQGQGVNSPVSAASGLGNYIVPAAIGAAAFSYGKQSLDAAREADSAQRILRASAKETGISYDKLSDSAAKFGAQTLQSNRAAQSSFAQIVTFANAAGRSEKLEEFRTKFADLAAAKIFSHFTGKRSNRF